MRVRAYRGACVNVCVFEGGGGCIGICVKFVVFLEAGVNLFVCCG